MKKIQFGYKNKNGAELFALCWIAYFSTYICRLNYSAVMPELSANGLFSETQIASVSSAFFIFYGLGQIVSGSLGDRYSPQKMIFYGVMISGLSNIAIFFLYQNYYMILFLWALNGAVQSMVWSPILRIAGEYFEKNEKEKFGIDIATTVPLGTLASYGISLVTMLFLDWKFVFLTCGIFVLICSFVWILGTDRVFKILKPVLQSDDIDDENIVSKISVKKLFSVLFSCGIFFLLISIIIQGALKDSVTQWIPVFLNNNFSVTTNISVFITMFLPIINVTGAYFARTLNKKLKNELHTSTVFFFISFVALLILFIFGTKNIILTMICLATAVNCMFAINVMIITMIPLYFSKYGRVSTVSGILNSTAYIGCGVLNYFAGLLLEKTNSNWNSLIIMWLVISAIAVIVTFICAFFWKKFLTLDNLNK